MTLVCNAVNRHLPPPSLDGIQYNPGMCPCYTSYAFFEEFSNRFARAAKGTIFYLTFGEAEEGAFRENSFFARDEIPFLNRNFVNNVVVLVVHLNWSKKDTGEWKSCCYNFYNNDCP